MTTDPEARIAALERQLAEMERVLEALATFAPVVVDLRINGAVRPVVIFAREYAPPAVPTFSVVPREP